MRILTTARRPRFAALVLTTTLLGACNSETASAPAATTTADPIGNVVVVGDSLADVGSFGSRATIQNSADPAAGFPLFPELIAQGFGIATQCNFYAYDNDSATFTTRAGCRNFAVGGSRILNAATRGGASVPLNIPTQLAQAVVAAGNHWNSGDLLLVDGGANDLADLAGAYLGAGRGRVEQYRGFLLQQLDAVVVDPLLAGGAPGLAEAGRLYMQALADTYYGAIQAQALGRGARHVAMLNIPDVTLTPRVRAALAMVAVNVSQAYADSAQAAAQQWAAAYNLQLQERTRGDTRVVLVDFHSAFTALVTHATEYGISNVSAASCPDSGADGMGLPNYSLAACTSAALDAAPPEGLAAGWWQSWLFADDFHLTPYGHRLLAGTIGHALTDAGWR